MRIKQSTTLAISLTSPHCTIKFRDYSTVHCEAQYRKNRNISILCSHLCLYVCVCAYVRVCVCVCVHKSACSQIQVLRSGSACVLLVWKSESTLQESILSFHSVAPRDKLVLSHSAASVFAAPSLCPTCRLSTGRPTVEDSHENNSMSTATTKSTT